MTLGNRRDPPSARELGATLFRHAKQHAADDKEVIAAVRSRGQDASREERRTFLEEELRNREVTRDPMWIEHKLDDLELTGLQRTARKGEAVFALGALVPSLLRGGEGEQATPEWMQPPDDAQVDVCSPLVGAPRATERSAIVLDTGVDAVLERAIRESPVRAGHLAAGVELWFDRPPSGGSEVSAYIGSHKIGSVAPETAAAARKSVDGAAKRGERPRGHGVLSKADHLSPPYLLVVTLPAPGAADN